MTRSPNFDPFAELPEGEEESAEELTFGFPRHHTRELLSRADRWKERRQWLAAIALGVAVGLFALANPCERLSGMTGLFLTSVRDHGVSPYLIPGLIVRALEPIYGLERAAFLLSAISLGALVPVLDSICRIDGEARPSMRLVVILLLVGSPGMWLAGVSPGPEAMSALVAARLFRRWLQRRPWRRAGLLAVLVDPANLFLILALVAPQRRKEESDAWSSQAVLPDFGAWVVLMFAFFLAVTRQPMTGSETTPGFGLLSLGVATFHLVHLALVDRNVAPWVVFPLFPGLVWCLFGVLFVAPLWCLGPACVIAFQRGRLRWAGLLVVAQLLATEGMMTVFEHRDPHLEWRESVRVVLEPEDCVIVDDPREAYYLRIRYGVTIIEAGSPDEPLETVSLESAAGRRVLVGADDLEQPWARELTLVPLSERWSRVVDD